MPKIDRLTGCEVMTELEFWQAEGERNETSAVEEMTRFASELEDERKREEDQMYDPKYVFEMVEPEMVMELECYNEQMVSFAEDVISNRGIVPREDYESAREMTKPPKFLKCTEVTNVDYSMGMMNSGARISAIFVDWYRNRATNKYEERPWKVEFSYASFAGTREEPPDCDTELTYELVQEEDSESIPDFS